MIKGHIILLWKYKYSYLVLKKGENLYNVLQYNINSICIWNSAVFHIARERWIASNNQDFLLSAEFTYSLQNRYFITPEHCFMKLMNAHRKHYILFLNLKHTACSHYSSEIAFLNPSTYMQIIKTIKDHSRFNVTATYTLCPCSFHLSIHIYSDYIYRTGKKNIHSIIYYWNYCMYLHK